MKALIVLIGLVVAARAHMSIYVPSMWGSEPGNINSNWAVQPLENLDFVDWWMHGQRSLNDPPAANAITQLTAGGTADFEITGNKAFTSMGRGLWCFSGMTPRMVPVPWSNGMDGGGSANIHAPTHADVAGCALAIAYKSDVSTVQPADFVVFSVVHDCIARQLQAFDIPALPACPNGKCICGWFWIHNSVGGTDQMYMTAFQCNIENPSSRVIGKPVPPVRCDGKSPCYLYPNWGNKTSTCPKTLQPMYWANNQGNNMANPTNSQCAPVFEDYYGFPDGAQHQIFVDGKQPPAGTVGDTLFSVNGTNSITSPSDILASPSWHTKFQIQGDGNIVLSDISSGKTYWASNTNGKGTAPYKLTLGQDGNLVATDSKGSTIWSSNTANLKNSFAPYRLKVRDVNELVLVDSNSQPLWTPFNGTLPIELCP